MIIATKLHAPRPRTPIVARSRLVRQLHEGLNHALTLVTAPAGYGKTTLLSEWSTALDGPVGWISLDRGDNDRARFWSYAAAALKRACPSFDEQAVLRAGRGDASGSSMLAAFINGLNRLEGSVVLIWDDFHLIDDREILADMAYVLGHLPDHAHFYIASRSMPELPLSRMRTRGQLLLLDTADLRFMPEEAADFFGSVPELRLSAREEADVLERTEGWAAGMRLAALLLGDAPNREQKIRRITGKQRDYADYFLEEILSQQPQTLQQYLIRTSILDRMNAELGASVTGMDDSARLLQELEQGNAFLVSLDDERRWYRYHHLFGQFLREQLQVRYPGLEQELHAAAGRWLEDNGFAYEAMEHYLSGSWYDQALRLLEKLAPQMMRSDWRALRVWFAAIPDAMLFGKPMLFMMKMASLFLSGQYETAAQALAWAREKMGGSASLLPEPMAGKIRAGISVLEAFNAFFARDFAASIRYSEQYVQLHPEGDLFAGLGTDEDGAQPMWDIYAAAGRLDEAESVIGDYLRVWSGTNNVFFVAHLHLNHGKLLYEQNRLAEAEAAFRRAMETGERYRNVNLIVVPTLWIARIRAAEGLRDEAESLVGAQAGSIDRAQYPQLYGRIRMLEVWLERMRGETNGTAASRWLLDCGLRREDEIPLPLMEEYDLYACLLADQGNIQEALRLNDRLLRMADQQGRRPDKVRLLVHRSIIAARRQEAPLAGMTELDSALAFAWPDRYVRTFVDKGAQLGELLARYVHSRQHQQLTPAAQSPLQYAKQLLRLIARGDGREGGTALPVAPVLTDKERSVLQLVEAGLTNGEIAIRLDIAKSTVKTHINNIYGKLQATGRLQALERARQWRLL